MKGSNDLIFTCNLESLVLEHSFEVFSAQQADQRIIDVNVEIFANCAKDCRQDLLDFEKYPNWNICLILNTVLNHKGEMLDLGDYHRRLVGYNKGAYTWWAVLFIVDLDCWDEGQEAVLRVELQNALNVFFESRDMLLFSISPLIVLCEQLDCVLLTYHLVIALHEEFVFLEVKLGSFVLKRVKNHVQAHIEGRWRVFLSVVSGS